MQKEIKGLNGPERGENFSTRGGGEVALAEGMDLGNRHPKGGKMGGVIGILQKETTKKPVYKTELLLARGSREIRREAGSILFRKRRDLRTPRNITGKDFEKKRTGRSERNHSYCDCRLEAVEGKVSNQNAEVDANPQGSAALKH